MKELEAKVEKLEQEISELRTDIKDLVNAWNTARGVTSFVKWVGSLATGAAVLYNLMTHWGSK
jgi:uncharacterized protein (UPF0335 family)